MSLTNSETIKKVIDTLSLEASRNTLVEDLLAANSVGMKDLRRRYIYFKEIMSAHEGTEIMKDEIEPYIIKKYSDLGKPELVINSIGAYMFGCFTGDVGVEGLSIFCTPLCAPSFRPYNETSTEQVCEKKIYYTKDSEGKIIRISKKDSRVRSALLFIPWKKSKVYTGIPQLCMDDMAKDSIERVAIYGYLTTKTFEVLQPESDLSEINASKLEDAGVEKESTEDAAKYTGIALLVFFTVVVLAIFIIMKRMDKKKVI